MGDLKEIEEFAAMKVNAITGQASRKDFVDLYYLLKEYSLPEIIGFYKKKYFDASPYLALKSLTYYEDAEIDAEPEMIHKVEWEDVKLYLRKKVKEYEG
jgi:hypothetical protein